MAICSEKLRVCPNARPFRRLRETRAMLSATRRRRFTAARLSRRCPSLRRRRNVMHVAACNRGLSQEPPGRRADRPAYMGMLGRDDYNVQFAYEEL